MPQANIGPPIPVQVDLPITLGQFIKMTGLATTGGEAKYMVVSGLVRVNAGVERRRGRRLLAGDVVAVEGADSRVVAGS